MLVDPAAPYGENYRRDFLTCPGPRLCLGAPVEQITHPFSTRNVSGDGEGES